MRTRRPLLGLAVAIVLAAGCGVDDPGADPVSTTTSLAPRTTTATTGRTSSERDVPDSVYPGLGDPRIDVARYDVVVHVASSGPKISGQVRIVGRVRTAVALRSFTLDLHALRVQRASVDDRPASVVVDGDQIVVTPARALAAGARFTADLTYAGTPEPVSFAALPGLSIGWQPDGDGGTFTLSEPYGTRTWMPVSEHPSDKAVFRISVDVPDGRTAVGNGRLVSRRPGQRGRTTWTWGDPAPMAPYLASVAVGDYAVVQRAGPAQSPDALRVVSAFPATSSAAKRAAFGQLDEILPFFAKRFGPYPFATAGVLVVPKALGLALETQTRPTFGVDSFDGAGSLAHELAHQWFGDAVSPATWRDVWLSEGFATYATWEWTEHDGGPSVAESARQAWEGLGPSTEPVLARTPENEFDQVVYERGALTLYAVRQELGATRFDTLLRRWVHTFQGKAASTAQFEAMASGVAGHDLSGLFDRWLDQSTVPPFPG